MIQKLFLNPLVYVLWSELKFNKLATRCLQCSGLNFAKGHINELFSVYKYTVNSKMGSDTKL